MAKLKLGRTGYEFGTGPVETEIRRWEKSLKRLESNDGPQSEDMARTKAMLKEKINGLYAWRTEILEHTDPERLKLEQEQGLNKEVSAVFHSERDKPTKRKVKQGPKLLNAKYRHARGHKQVDAAIGSHFIKPKGPTVPNTAYRIDRGNNFIPGTEVRQRDPLPRKFERPARSGPKTGGRRGHFRTRYR